MVKKKTSKKVKRANTKKTSKKETKNVGKKVSKQVKKSETMELKTEHDIAMDFAIKAYKKFDKVIKSIVLFGSVAREEGVVGSDIDIILIIDDAALKWDQEMIAWYREELDKLLRSNPYNQSLHINTVKLTTWWEDLMRGDPVVINVLRHGQAMIDHGGFFNPLKALLLEGKIKPSPEAIYTALQRAPLHIAHSKMAEVSAIEGIYWSMVDSAHAALIAMNILPPSPDHLAVDLRDNFIATGKLKSKYVDWYKEILMLHKKISHGQIKDLKGADIDEWQERAQEFVNTMAKLVRDIVSFNSE